MSALAVILNTMNIRQLAKSTFQVKGSSALIIICFSFSFISAAAATYNLIIDPANPTFWASLIMSATVYIFASALIIADIFNAREDNKLDTVLAKD